MSSLCKAAGALVIVAGATLLAQTPRVVKVTVARANIRSEPNDKAPVLMQATAGMSYEVTAVEGDWFKVVLNLGTIRTEAYLSKKVAAPVVVRDGRALAYGGSAASSASSASVPPPPAPVTTIDGMSVALQTGGATTWLVPHRIRAVAWRDRRVDSIASLAAAALNDEPAPEAGANGATYVWLIDGAGSDRTLEDPRPSFLAVFKDVPGVSPDDLGALLVKLGSSSASTRRLIAAARGNADQRSHGDSDWDLIGRELKQDVIRSTVEGIERGAVRIRPNADLAPGEYAVVLRPTSKKKLAGAEVLTSTGEGRVFGLVWDFAIK
jgi:SH3 domain-containing protein